MLRICGPKVVSLCFAQEKCQSEYLKITQEKEQQESLALEELELQKKAVLTESENKLRNVQQEAETYRTVSLNNLQVQAVKLLECEDCVISPVSIKLQRMCVTGLDLHVHTLHF